MIRRFRRLSIRTKLIAAILTTSVVAVLFLSAAMLSYLMLEFRRTVARELSTEAEIVGANCAAAMAFVDKPVAEETLYALEAHPGIVRAVLFDNRGQVFAEYRPDRSSNAKVPEVKAEPFGSRFEKNCFLVFRPIRLGDDPVGSIALVCDLREQNARLIISGLIMLGVIVLAISISILLSVKLQSAIAEPILALAKIARRITVEKDYSLRASTEAQDETGVLVRGFNGMLSEIEKRDTELRASEGRFRQLAETIREVFWISDVTKNKTIYVSPGYEHIWGRPVESLYARGADWMDALHPDDRDRIATAARSKQVLDQYDEEYRIIRPDGTVRWIHDRAFAIRDEKGEVYRVAGIAADITLRKQLEKQILEISDREQSRIGQDLHDGLSQHLVRIGFAVDVMRQELERQGNPEEDRARKIAELVDQSITQARHLARGLYPVKLETEGLRSGLEELAAKIRGEHKIACEVESPDGFEVKEYAVAIHLYRIAQEAVTNAIKHARASHVGICLEEKDGKLVMTISDNGKGFAKPQSTPGMGLHIMNYRAKMIGAELDVAQRSAGGTVVSCVLYFKTLTSQLQPPNYKNNHHDPTIRKPR